MTEIEEWLQAFPSVGGMVMAEEEWLQALPSLMLHHIQQKSQASIRKLRLLAVAYARYLESQPDYANSKHVSHLGEAVLEGRETLDILWDYRNRGWGYDGNWSIANLVLSSDEQIDMSIRKAMYLTEYDGVKSGMEKDKRNAVARSKILCVMGNPFRPVAVDPTWLTDTVVSLASVIYQDRVFDRMPILADALEEAGCANADILNHSRQPGEHVRGCWVFDLLLGKG